MGANANAVEYYAQRAQDDLAAYFEKSNTTVQEYSVRFEQEFLRPALTYYYAAYDQRPALVTFLSIFALLSVVPLLLFIGSSICVIITFALFALASAVGAILAAEALFGTILLSTLVVIFFFSCVLTASVISAFLFFRFITLLRKAGVDGITEWVDETRGRMSNVPSHVASRADSPFPYEKRWEPEFDDIPTTSQKNVKTESE